MKVKPLAGHRTLERFGFGVSLSSDAGQVLKPVIPQQLIGSGINPIWGHEQLLIDRVWIHLSVMTSDHKVMHMESMLAG